MVFSSMLGRPTVARESFAGEVLTMEMGGTRWAPRWEHAGTSTPVYLQELYGPEYVKKGFAWTPLDLLPAAAQLVPGAGLATPALGALGLTGSQGMSNGGYEPWIGVGGWGLGVCPSGTRCVGGVAGGVCLGTCIPSGPSIVTPPTGPGIGPVYGGNGNGAVVVQPNGQAVTCCPAGKRPNKTDYFLKNGTFIPKGSKCVSYRRRNPLNPRAWNKAYRRLKSAESWAKKYSTGPKRAHVKTAKKKR